jgi:hypothetical protein
MLEPDLKVYITIHLPGDMAYGENASTPVECFQHFIDEEMIAYIVGKTNYTIAEIKWKKLENKPFLNIISTT